MASIITKIIKYETTNADSFSCELRANIDGKESFVSWLKSFEAQTKTNWILRSSKLGEEESRFAFSRDYVCQHSSYCKKLQKPEGTQKDKKCPATLKVRIKRDTKQTRYKDPYIKEGLCAIININFHHSHHLNVAEALNWLRRKDVTRETFITYFNNGMSPADARHYHEDMLLVDDAGIEVLADASINPPQKWVYYLHDLWRKTQYGGAKKDENFYSISERRISELKDAGYKAILNKEPFYLCLMSPIMQRTLKSCEEYASIFIDSSASCDQTCTSVTVISVATKAGALPIGIGLTSNQTEVTYEAIFSVFFNMWADVHSNFRMEMIMTDDSQALRNALSVVWPNVRLLLCQFHVLQAVWRWLWSSKNCIKNQDRKHLITLFKSVMYSTDETLLNESKEKLFADKTALLYPSFITYFENLCKKENDWSFCGRKYIINRRNNTNNFAEASFRILKDIILTRLKAYNALALVDFLTTVLEKYYKVRLMDNAYGRVRKPFLLFQKVAEASNRILEDSIEEVDENMYEVTSKDGGKKYLVNSIIGVCDCFNGVQGSFCIHQAAVSIKYKINFINSPSLTVEDKVTLAKIALGDTAPPAHFFASMNKIHSEEATKIDSQAPSTSTMMNISEMCDNHSSTVASSSVTQDEGKVEIHELNEDANERNGEQVEENNINFNYVQNFEMHMNKIISVVKNNPNDASLMKAVKYTVSKMKNIDSAEKVTEFLYGVSLGCRMKFGKTINVQPTAIARRRDGARKGCKRVAAGRPLKELTPAPKKRKRYLKENIDRNVPNAKSHGTGH